MPIEQQVVDYLQKARQAGQSDDKSRTLLYNNGWTEQEVSDALASLSSANKPQSQPQPQIQSQAQPQFRPQPQPQQQVQTAKPQVEAKPQPQVSQQAQPQVQPRVQPQPQQQPQSQAQGKPFDSAQDRPFDSAQGKPQIQPQTEQPQAQQQVKPQPQPAAQYQYPRPAEPAQAYAPQNSMPAERKKSHLAVTLAMVLVILAVIGAGGYFALGQKNLINNILKLASNSTATKNTAKIKENQNSQPATAVSTQTAFAQYNLESTKYTPSLPAYQIALSELTNLSNFQRVQGNLSPAQTTALTNDNFFIAKNNDKFYSTNVNSQVNRNDDWSYLYGTIGGPYETSSREPQNSVFVTTDFLAHTYHKLVDEEFAYIEETNLYPALDNLSKSLLKSSSADFASATVQDQKDSYERLSSYFLVTSSILENASADYRKFQAQNYIDDTRSDTKTAVLALADSLAKLNNVSVNAKNIAKQEIGLIFDAKIMSSSPLMGKYQPGMKEDYTQYGPRSHYVKNAILRDYFRAMMYYGRMDFLVASPELTRDAANITQLLNPDELKQWESIYQPTSFFVGKADDLTIEDYNKAESKTGFGSSDNSSETLTKLQNELLAYPNPQIMSSAIISQSVASTSKQALQNSTKGFRFMGQRFTADAFIFTTLTQGDELPDTATGQSLPSMPTALMVSTLMGSKESANLLNTWITTNAPNSNKVLANRISTLQNYFAATTQQQWTQNIYWSWLYTIKSLFTDLLDKAGYPMFMKSENWDKKALQSFLGSWTELKHDTLLYAKQSYAEKGAGGQQLPPNPVPKGYVEPNVDFLDRLISLVDFTDSGLSQFGIMPANFTSRNEIFKNALTFYRTIAVSELGNKNITDDDFEKLRLSAGQLDNILQAPDSGIQLESNARSALIADTATDVKTGKILYEADGIPNYIYVAVKDANGTRLTKGLVYSYYEFPGPLATRYTDQVWQGWEYSKIPQKLQMPWWSKALVK